MFDLFSSCSRFSWRKLLPFILLSLVFSVKAGTKLHKCPHLNTWPASPDTSMAQCQKCKDSWGSFQTLKIHSKFL